MNGHNMDKIDEKNINEDKSIIEEILDKLNEIIDWINSQ
mgnify:CR=1 FL=1|tara:strand:+ start:2520 stop:2636 length:117 start_codon:yes stop_codon:yes gene_type:complete